MASHQHIAELEIGINIRLVQGDDLVQLGDRAIIIALLQADPHDLPLFSDRLGDARGERMHEREPLAGIDIVRRDLHDSVVDRARLLLPAQRPVHLGSLLQARHGVLELPGASLLLGHAHQAIDAFIQKAAPDVQARQAAAERDIVGRQLDRIFKRLDRPVEVLAAFVVGRQFIKLRQSFAELALPEVDIGQFGIDRAVVGQMLFGLLQRPFGPFQIVGGGIGFGHAPHQIPL